MFIENHPYMLIDDEILYDPTKFQIKPKSGTQKAGLRHTNQKAEQKIDMTINNVIQDRWQRQRLDEMARNPAFGIAFLMVHRYRGAFADLRMRITEKGGWVSSWKISVTGVYTGRLMKMDWEEEMIVSSWDVYGDTDFEAGLGANEGLTFVDDGITWYAGVGNWLERAGWHYVRCTWDNGENKLVMDVPTHSNKSDVIVTSEVNTKYRSGIIIRCVDSTARWEMKGYALVIEGSSDVVQIWRNNTVLREWDWDIADNTAYPDTTYILRLQMCGNVLMAWIDGIYLGCVIDDGDSSYIAGTVGLYAQDSNSHFFTFKCEIGKPRHIAMPVGATQLDCWRMWKDDYLISDDNCDMGEYSTIIEPQEPVVFDYLASVKNDPDTVYMVCPSLDEGGNKLRDHSSNQLAGTAGDISGAKWSDKSPGSNFMKSLFFDAVDDYVRGDNAEQLTLDYTHHFIVEAIVYCNGWGENGQGRIFDQRNTNNDGWMLAVDDATNRVYFYGRSTAVAPAKRVYSVDNALTLGTWYHIAVVSSGMDSNTLKVYVNGNDMTTSTNLVNTALIGTGPIEMRLGDRTNSDRCFDGYIAYWRIAKRSYTDAEVAEHYDQLFFPKPAGGEVKVWDDCGTDGFWESLVFWGKHDEGEGEVVFDSSKNGLAMSVASANFPVWMDSYNKWGKTALDFDDTLQTYYAVTGAGNHFQLQEFTYCCWVKNHQAPGAYPNHGKYMSLDYRGDGTWADPWALVCIDTNGVTGEPRFTINFGGATLDQGLEYDSNPMAQDVWYFLCGTYDGLTMKLYVNGALVAETTRAADVDYTAQIGKDLTIGCRSRYNTGEYVDATIDDPMVFSKALNAAEVEKVYQSAPRIMWEEGLYACEDKTCEDARGVDLLDNIEFYLTMQHFWTDTPTYDASGNDIAVTLISIDPARFEDSYSECAGKCYDFDGVADYLTMDLSAVMNNAAGMISMMFYSDDVPGVPTEYLFAHYNWVDTRTYIRINNSSELHGVLGDIAGNMVTISHGRWYHVAMTWDGQPTGTGKLYLDGKLVDVWSYTGMNALGNSWAVGAYLGGSGFFDGKMDDIICTSDCPTADEIRALYVRLLAAKCKETWLWKPWQRVKNIGHPFEGRLWMDNGLVRWHVIENPDIAAKIQHDLYAWTNGQWEKPLAVMPANCDCDADGIALPVPVEIGRYHAIIRVTMIDTEYNRISGHYNISMRSGMPLIEWEAVSTDWNNPADHSVNHYIFTPPSYNAGNYCARKRFRYLELDDMKDAWVDINANNANLEGQGDNFWLFFGPENDVICGMIFRDEISTTNDRMYHQRYDTIGGTIRFDFGPANYKNNVKGAWLLAPFDTSILQYYADAATVSGEDWSGAPGAAVTWQLFTQVVALLTDLDADEMTITADPLPAGSYRAFFLLNSTAGTEDATVYTTGALADGSQDFDDIIDRTVGHTWAWCDFIADDGDIVTFHVNDRTNQGTWIYWAELIIWPLFNSKNFPGDRAHQALKPVSQKLLTR